MQPAQPETDFVVYLMGRIATNDGSPIPNDMLVERICSEHVRQQVYASSNGDFSMQMGSKNDSFLDATADAPSPGRLNNKTSLEGIPQRELKKCELQASAAGLDRKSVV